MGVLDTLAAATPFRRTETMCLDGAVQAQLDAIDFQAAVDQDKKHASLAHETPAFDAAIDDYEALRDKAAASEVTFVFESMPWTERVTLQAEHPPRDGNMADLVRGYNFETYLPELIRRSVIEVTDADGDTTSRDDIPAATWVTLLGKPAVPARDATDDEPATPAVPAVAGSLNANQVNRLVAAAQGVNESAPAVPPSARSLRESQDSGTSSAQPSPGTSAPDGGEDGNPPTSPTSTTGRKQTRKRAPAKKASSARSAGS